MVPQKKKKMNLVMKNVEGLIHQLDTHPFYPIRSSLLRLLLSIYLFRVLVLCFLLPFLSCDKKKKKQRAIEPFRSIRDSTRQRTHHTHRL